jgi:hypothetical protein
LEAGSDATAASDEKYPFLEHFLAIDDNYATLLVGELSEGTININKIANFQFLKVWGEFATLRE